MNSETTSQPPCGRPSGPAMPLMMADEGQDVTLVEIRGGDGLIHRLAEMGLTPGVRFRVVASGRRGACIVNVKDSRLMLGHGMIHRIFVAPEPPRQAGRPSLP